MKTIFTAAAWAALAALLVLSPPALAQQKTLKQCREEWSSNKTALAASGKTQRAFLAECRGLARIAIGKGQYASEAEAKAHCPTDGVVWTNPRSKVYHVGSSKSYGTTKIGAYMCEKESVAAGFRAPKLFTRSPKDAAS